MKLISLGPAPAAPAKPATGRPAPLNNYTDRLVLREVPLPHVLRRICRQLLERAGKITNSRERPCPAPNSPVRPRPATPLNRTGVVPTIQKTNNVLEPIRLEILFHGLRFCKMPLAIQQLNPIPEIGIYVLFPHYTVLHRALKLFYVRVLLSRPKTNRSQPQPHQCTPQKPTPKPRLHHPPRHPPPAGLSQ